MTICLPQKEEREVQEAIFRSVWNKTVQSLDYKLLKRILSCSESSQLTDATTRLSYHQTSLDLFLFLILDIPPFGQFMISTFSACMSLSCLPSPSRVDGVFIPREGKLELPAHTLANPRCFCVP